MSFQAWAASWSAYTVATSGRIVPSSSSRAILPSTSADGASLIISPDTRCLAVSSLDSSGPWLQARLEQTGKGRSHVDEDRGPEYSHEEGQRKPARSMKDTLKKSSFMANGKLLTIKSQPSFKMSDMSTMTKFRSEQAPVGAG